MILLLAVFAVIALSEVPTLIREKRWRELIAFSALYGLALFYASSLTLGAPPPSPIRLIMYFIKDVLHIGYTG
ncbi:hypothetical protein SAMN02745168_0261 [Papillibacter cinnamivorans DSM 12816]|uniref:Uncharacterized protein n=2 Tax=Papillibacter TaxID=100175 RepID=A0A1W2CY49_9FIRM|nr:hypothetical protein SAMN02745168_0261 [Papillibacter cinnamivorans DSM 12816]